MVWRKSLAWMVVGVCGAVTSLAQHEKPADPKDPPPQTNDQNAQDRQDKDRQDKDRMTRSSTGAYMGGEVRWFAPAKRWQKASDIIGKAVKNDKNENLGKVENLVLDTGSGRMIYGVLSFGGILGIGDKYFAIPWASLDLPGDAKNFVLAIDKEQLKNAEGFDKTHWPNAADERWATNTNKYYGQPPYWSRGDSDVHTAGDVEGRKGGEMSARERWFHPATGWQKVSDLMGKDVRNLQNEKLGDVNDLVIDPDTGRVLYAILSTSGKYVSVPWSALSLSSGYEHFVLDMTPQRLKDAASFTKDSWPNLTEPAYVERTYVYFNQHPYWTSETITERREVERGKP